jgi:hypothetical protein
MRAHSEPSEDDSDGSAVPARGAGTAADHSSSGALRGTMSQTIGQARRKEYKGENTHNNDERTCELTQGCTHCAAGRPRKL